MRKKDYSWEDRRVDLVNRKIVAAICVTCMGGMVIWGLYWLSGVFR